MKAFRISASGVFAATECTRFHGTITPETARSPKSSARDAISPVRESSSPAVVASSTICWSSSAETRASEKLVWSPNGVAPRAGGVPSNERDVFATRPHIGAYRDAKWAMESRAAAEQRLEVVVACPSACLGTVGSARRHGQPHRVDHTRGQPAASRRHRQPRGRARRREGVGHARHDACAAAARAHQRAQHDAAPPPVRCRALLRSRCAAPGTLARRRNGVRRQRGGPRRRHARADRPHDPLTRPKPNSPVVRALPSSQQSLASHDGSGAASHSPIAEVATTWFR